MSLHQAQRWAGSIVVTLAADGPLRDRVLAASVPSFMNLQADAAFEDYLPETVQKRIDALLVQLTARQLPSDSHEAIEATVSGMSELELAECAEEMVQIAAEVIERNWDTPHQLHAVR